MNMDELWAKVAKRSRVHDELIERLQGDLGAKISLLHDEDAKQCLGELLMLVLVVAKSSVTRDVEMLELIEKLLSQ